MKQKTWIGLSLVAVIAVVGAMSFSLVLNNNKNTKKADEKKIEDAAIKKSEDSAITKDDKMMDSKSKVGSYIGFDSAKFSNAKTGKVVIFFAAPWCPECRKLDANITANLGAIPANLTILKADYDKETALKQKYGVTYQHTMVQVDENGNLLKKWSGSPTLAELNAMTI